MNEAKHTPGQWTTDSRAIRTHFEPRFVAVMCGKKEIAHCYYGETDEEVAANARLIAAAPDLLTAIKLFVGFANNGKHPKWASYLDTQAGFNMKSAILKAEGRAQ